MRFWLLGGAPPKSAAGWALAFGVIAATLVSTLPIVRLLDQAVIGSSSATYLQLAVNRAWCGRYPFLSAVTAANASAIDPFNQDVARVSGLTIRQLLVDGTGSLQGYCRSVREPFVMNEMSFVLVESAVLRVFPNVTYAGLAGILAFLRMTLLCAFGLCLVRAGCSLIFASGLTLAAAYLTVLTGGNALFSQYPFFVPVTVFGIGAAAAFLSAGWHRHDRVWLAMSCGLGVWAGFLGNLRTSLYPEALLAGLLFIGFAARARRETPGVTVSHKRWLALACTAWLLGLLAFDTVYIRPVRSVPSTGNSSAHGIAHPLVLGLASPPNALAAREGIQWNDDVGRVLAQRVDPTVPYLGPGYEGALYTYYRSLWSRYPGEMFEIYRQKLSATAEAIFAVLLSTDASIFWSHKDGYWLHLAALPFATVARWLPIPIVFGLLFASGQIRWRGRDTGRVFLVSVIGLVGALAFAESFIILGGVVLWYSSVLLLCTIFAGALGYQWAVNLAWRALTATAQAASPGVLALARSSRQAFLRITRWLGHELQAQPARPALARAAAHLIAAVVTIVLIVPQWLVIERTPTRDPDAIARLSAAISRAKCGLPMANAAANGIVDAGLGDADAMIRPIDTMILDSPGGRDGFCASPPASRSFSSSALLQLETSIVRARPSISFAGIAKFLHYLRVFAVFTAVAALAAAGAGVFVATLAGLAGLGALVWMKEALFSVSTFGPVLLFQSLGFLAVAIRYRWMQTRGLAVVLCSISWCGVVAALCPSWLAAQVGLFAVFFAFNGMRERRSAARAE